MTKQIYDQKSKKTKKKLVTQWINAPLIALDSGLKKYYERAYHCSSVLFQEGDVVTSRYCNCRTCITCNGIRTASYIAGYGKQVMDLVEPQFVTLTAPTVQCFDSDTLKHFIEAREYIWRKIYKNASTNGNGVIKLTGLKAMEITARPDDYYHIHFHFIVSGVKNAEWLKSQWLKHYPDAMEYLQVIKPITSEGGLLEVFKYGTKFIEQEKVNHKGKIITGYKKVEPHRLDLIIQALHRKRLISTFGGIKRVKDDNVNEIVVESKLDGLKTVEYDVWRWINDIDWFSELSGKKFSSFVPSKNFKSVFIRDQ